MTLDADLQRFIDAQQDVYPAVLRELRAGRKQSHWMWFIFPQLAGLGRSATAKHYAIASLAEAAAYLRHPVLGARLQECSGLVLQTDGRTVGQIFGYPDDLKFHSCMTLFAQVPAHAAVFDACLQKYFAGRADAATLALLAA